MDVLGKVHGRDGVLVILGSGLYFGWFDALYMKKLFLSAAAGTLLPEAGALLVFALSTPVALLVLWRAEWMDRLVQDRRAILAAAACGTVGSLGLLLSSFYGSWAILVPSALLGGLYMAFGQFCWCAAYSRRGAETTTPFITGAFSCAVCFDLVPLLMVEPASSVVFALFPLAATAFYLVLGPEHKRYPRAEGTPSRARGRVAFRSTIGMSSSLVVAFAFMFVCFGFLQHNMSFASATVGGVDGGTVVQVCRGLVAMLLFVCLVVLEVRPSIVYRAGLLVMIAGCLGASLLVGTGLQYVANCVIMAGFTSFNVLIYVTFVQVAYAMSRSPVRTIAVRWLLTGFGVSVGGLCGILLTGVNPAESPHLLNCMIVVGYFVSMAAVLLLSSEDIWIVLGSRRMPAAEVEAPAAPPAPDAIPASDAAPDVAPASAPTLADRLADLGLTARETEIALLLVQGRTRAWIADNLVISENTVATHVRHIYEKVGVRNRQEFIDFTLAADASQKTNDSV